MRKIPATHFLRACLLMPVLVMALSLLFISLDLPPGGLGNTLAGLLVFGFGSLLFGGPAYLVFLLGATIYLRGRCEADHRTLWRWAPAIHAALVAIYVAALAGDDVAESFSSGLMMAAIAFAAAWCYVGLTFALLGVAKRAGLVG